jgi:hypothetical protein
MGIKWDPNRDFPYDNRPDDCMKTATARVLNSIYAKYLIQTAVTFHGGEMSLSIPYKNHLLI